MKDIPECTWNMLHQVRSGITCIRYVLEYPSSGTFQDILHRVRFWNIVHQVRSGISFIRYVLEYPSSGTFWNILHQVHFWKNVPDEGYSRNVPYEGYPKAYLMKDIPERT
jgi:hypothetical protein